MSYASSTPYSLYQQLLANWAGVTPDLPEAMVRPALERVLARMKGTEDLFPLLARMMGLSGAALERKAPEEIYRATFAAWRSLLAGLVTARPAVLVLEDLHWADPTSLHLTGHLARLAAGRPLLVIATSRPDAAAEVSSMERLLDGGPPLRRITLGRLSGAAERTLASSLIGAGVSPEILDTVLASVDGNPLFLEERLSSLLETKALVQERGTWRMSEAVRHEVPQALERLVRSRVDRLTPAARDAVRRASVLGFEFPLSLLTAVCAVDQPLEAVLDELRAKDFLHDVTGLPEPAFRFRHALIQEATYNGLLRSERRRLHGRAAWALEAASQDRLEEAAAVLGRHFAAAEEPDRAVTYLEMAGDHANSAFANDEAISEFRAAMAIVRDSAVAAQLQSKLANVLWRTGRRDEARQALREALDLADGGNTLRIVHLHTRLGRLEMADLRFDAAETQFDTADALLPDNPGTADTATAEEWLELMVDGRAGLYMMRDQPEQVLATLAAARPALERGSPARKFGFYLHLAFARVMRNRYRVDETDIAEMRKAVTAARDGDEEKDDGYATYFLGRLLWLRGDLEEAQELLERTLTMAERIGETILIEQCLLAIALTGLRRGDTGMVRAFAPRALASSGGMASSEYLVGAKACLAWLAWREGRPDDVLKLVSEIASVAVTAFGAGSHNRWVYLWPLLAVQLEAGQVADAVAAGRELLDPEQQRLPDPLEAALREAIAAWDGDNPELARQQLATALARARQLRYC